MSDGNAWNVSDDALAGLWAKMMGQKLLGMVFALTPMDAPEKFIAYFKDASRQFHLVMVPEGCAAVGWLSSFGHNSAAANFCVFREFWGKSAQAIAKHSLDYWFSFERDGEPLLKVIFGQTPEHNKLATMFLRRVGMTVLGTIPHMGYDPYVGQDVGMVISYITKEQNDGRH